MLLDAPIQLDDGGKATMEMTADMASELRVLCSLAHLGYATLEHLHALCFPDAASSTVRVCLAALRTAGWIQLTPWRLPQVCQERGSVWTLTSTGYAYLQSYGMDANSWRAHDLGVPSTALERDEWRVRMAVRSFVVRLILQARVHPTFAELRVHLRSCWPTPYAPLPFHGDAELTVVWSPATVQAHDWLPWQMAPTPNTKASRYIVLIDRPGAGRFAASVVDLALVHAQHLDATAVFVWESSERLQQARQRLADSERIYPPIRMSTNAALAHVLEGDTWQDAWGQPCSLRPQVGEQHGYHAPTVA